MMKNQKGITLIALVVTIVILIILAGVSIGMLTGDNGTISNANKASDETKKGNYQETLELIGINLQHTAKNIGTEELMEQYEKEIKKDKMFKKSQEIAKVENRKPITIQVTTEEGWMYWVTEYEVIYKEGIGIYASLNGNTLSFFDNEEYAYNNKDSEEHYLGDISTNNAWSQTSNISNLIEKIVIVDEIEPINMAGFFKGLSNLVTIENLDKMNTSRATKMNGLFADCRKLTTLNLSSFDTSNVDDMNGMFSNCRELTELDLKSFNTSNVTNMENMFYYCATAKSIDVSSFDTSKVTNMNNMFNHCDKVITLDVSNFNTSNVITMGAMFNRSSNLKELDVSKFDTSKVTSMAHMFHSCYRLNNIDVSGFNTSNVTDMSCMFIYCGVKTLDLSKWNTENVTNMSEMFRKCNNLTSLDLTNFNTLKVTNMSMMFQESGKLTSVLVGAKWQTAEKTDNMFNGCGVSEVTKNF